MSEKGSLFVWGLCRLGWGPFGTSRSKEVYFYEPKEVPTPDSVAYWTGIGALRTTCFGIDDKCRVWGWGDNTGGELGVPASEMELADTPIFVNRFCQSQSSSVRSDSKSERNITEIRLFPNPASKSVSAEFMLTKSEVLNIELLDILGRKMQTFSRSRYESGNHTITLNISNLESGRYILRIGAGEQTASASLIIE